MAMAKRERAVAKLTKRAVDALQPSNQDFTVWDTELRGFGCRIYPTRRRVFIFKYRVGGGRSAAQRKLLLGTYGAVTVDQARALAHQAHADVINGKDPAGARANHRRAETVKEFGERYLAEHADTKKSPRSAREDKRLLDRHVVPKLGTRKMADLSAADVTKLVHGLASTPIPANRVRSLLSKMQALAIAWGVRSDPVNPVSLVQKFPETSRERYLSSDEVKQLGNVLAEFEQAAKEPWQAIAAIRLLLFTGCRKSEVLSLQWSFIDYDNSAILLPTSKTGRKTVYLTAPVLELLATLPRKNGCPYIFPSRLAAADRHFEGLGHVWERVRRKAKLDGVRLHDLRHTFASKGVGLGLGLPIIGGLLGHALPTTTAKYAHLAEDPTRAAGERIARQLSGELRGGKSGGDSADVIPLTGRRLATGFGNTQA
jgi:integrase